MHPPMISLRQNKNVKRVLLGVFLALAQIDVAIAQSTGPYNYANIVLAAPTTTTLKSSPGVLHTICLNTPAANGVVTIYDSTTGAGTKIGTFTVAASGAQPSCTLYDVAFGIGLTIVTATAASDITVSYH